MCCVEKELIFLFQILHIQENYRRKVVKYRCSIYLFTFIYSLLYSCRPDPLKKIKTLHNENNNNSNGNQGSLRIEK